MGFLEKVRDIQEQKQRRVEKAEKTSNKIYQEIKALEKVEHPKFEGEFVVHKFPTTISVKFVNDNYTISYLTLSVEKSKTNKINLDLEYSNKKQSFLSTSRAINYIAEYIGNL